MEVQSGKAKSKVDVGCCGSQRRDQPGGDDPRQSQWVKIRESDGGEISKAFLAGRGKEQKLKAPMSITITPEHVSLRLAIAGVQ